MRSRSLVCAALAGFVFGAGLLSSTAHAADPKGKAAKKKSDDLADDKVIGKQLQWEDKVMGADDKRGELDKIAQAQAINKAASEKAEKDKAASEAREAKEKAAAEKAGPTTSKRGGEVALPTLPDEGPSKGKRKSQHDGDFAQARHGRGRRAAARAQAGRRQVHRQAAEGRRRGKKKKTVASDDKALIDMLSTEKPGKAAPRRRRSARTASTACCRTPTRQPSMGETKVKHETPEWAKPEIRSTPTPAPIVAHQAGQEGRRHHSRRPGRGRLAVRQCARPASATDDAPGADAGGTAARARTQVGGHQLAPGRVGRPVRGCVAAQGAAGKQVAAPEPPGQRRRTRMSARRARPRRAPSKREASRGRATGPTRSRTRERKATGTRGAAPAGKPSGGKPARPGVVEGPVHVV